MKKLFFFLIVVLLVVISSSFVFALGECRNINIPDPDSSLGGRIEVDWCCNDNNYIIIEIYDMNNGVCCPSGTLRYDSVADICVQANYQLGTDGKYYNCPVDTPYLFSHKYTKNIYGDDAHSCLPVPDAECSYAEDCPYSIEETRYGDGWSKTGKCWDYKCSPLIGSDLNDDPIVDDPIVDFSFWEKIVNFFRNLFRGSGSLVKISNVGGGSA